MTREEQIKTNTQNNLNDIISICDPSNEYIKGYTHGFKEGAEWADVHPNWHDANEELPEPDGDYLYSDDVLVDVYGDVYSGCYNHKSKCWVIYVFGENRTIDDAAYWMPLPKPLKEDYD